LILVLSSYRLLAAFCQHSWLRLGPHPQALLLRSHRMAEGSAYHPIAAKQRRAGGVGGGPARNQIMQTEG